MLYSPGIAPAWWERNYLLLHYMTTPKWNRCPSSVDRLSSSIGFFNLRHHNNSLMIKCARRLYSEEQTLWEVVISEKFGLQGCWITKPATSSAGVHVWNNIRSLWASGTNLQVLLGLSEWWKENYLLARQLDRSDPLKRPLSRPLHIYVAACIDFGHQQRTWRLEFLL